MLSEPIVYVVDDDIGVRKALSFLLASAGLNVRVYENAGAFLQEVNVPGPCCMITDVRMPGVDGLEFIRRLHDRGYRFPIIVMTGHADIPLAVAAMKAGATEFLEKPFREERLLKMVRHALAYNEESVRASQKNIGTQARLQSLSRRERQVLDALVDGKANKVIAHDLNISIRTVEIHRSNVMAKMEARGLSELIRMVLLIEAGPNR